MEKDNLSILPVSIIKSSPLNSRKFFDEEKLNELAESIKNNGLIQPIVVRRVGELYEVVCGERRLRASKIANLRTILTIVRKLTDQEVLKIQIIENLQRQDLNLIEQAKALKQLQDYNNYSASQLGAVIGRSKTWVLDHLSLLNFPEDFKQYMIEGKLKVKHMTPIKQLIGRKDLLDIVKKEIEDGSISVRKLWKITHRLKKERDEKLLRPDKIVDDAKLLESNFTDMIIKIKTQSNNADIHKWLDILHEIHTAKIMSIRRDLIKTKQELRQAKKEVKRYG